MAIPSTILDLSDVAASNYPQSTDVCGAAIYSLPQNIAAIIKKQFIAGSDITIVSSGTVTLPSENSYITIQGTGFNITGFAQCFNGRYITLHFAAAGLTLVNSASLILPGAASITTLAGDVAEFVNESTGVWRCTSYLRNDSGLSGTTVTATTSVTTPKVETSQGTDIASAATVNLETASGQYVNITGTTGITAITLSQGHIRFVKFAGALTLTNGASLILPGAANITTVAGDTAIFIGEAAGVVRCVSYVRSSKTIASGKFTRDSSVASGTQTITGLGIYPKAIRFYITNDNDSSTVIGIWDGTNNNVNAVAGGTPPANMSLYFYKYTGVVNSYYGYVSSAAYDQFTITWTRNNLPSGIITILWEAIG